MSLPLPDLDDRRFQQLVDDAKRHVQQACPEWSDHNVSDPGVTLIETFASMVEQLIYRANRVPDKLYLAFLDLIGVRPYAAAAARVDLTFWLSAPQPVPVVVPAGARASTLRTDLEDAVVFLTVEDCVVPPRSLQSVATLTPGSEPVVRDEALRDGSGFDVFAAHPQPGDLLLLGLDDPAPRCVVALRVGCETKGAGVDPSHPPLRWEAWTPSGWRECEVERDDTGGFNDSGDILLHIPPGHVSSVEGGRRGAWLRCVVTAPDDAYPGYRVSPWVRSIEAFVVAGTASATHADVVVGEVVGLSEGVAGQCFAVNRGPVLDDGEPLTVEVADGAGWGEWEEVSGFADHVAQDRIFRVDRFAGEIAFAPEVREPDGSLRRFGAIPPKGAPVRVRSYRYGGGTRGNLGSHTICVLGTTVPFVDRVDNRHPASGGVAAETLDEVRRRGPLDLRTRDRAVTAEDHELLALRAHPDVARVRCRPDESGVAKLLIVPRAARNDDGSLELESLMPSAELLDAVKSYLDVRRLVGSRIEVEPPYYLGVTVVARLVAKPREDPDLLRRRALRNLYIHLDPVLGGPTGEGWPFGRAVQTGEVYAVLQAVPGVQFVEEVRLFGADLLTGERGEQADRLPLGENALVFSFEHLLRVERG